MNATVPILSHKLGVINIIIADDQPIVRLGLRTLLESEPNFRVVGEASDGLEAVQLVKLLSPNVAIMDLMMPFLNGFEAARQVRAQCPHIRIVILSRFDIESYKSEAFNCGADAYVLKQSPILDLIVAIHEVLDLSWYLKPSLSEKMINSYGQSARTRTRKTVKFCSFKPLTRREREILFLVVQGYTSNEIAQRLVISARTVESHRAHMMHKLGLNSPIHLARFAIERGLVPVE